MRKVAAKPLILEVLGIPGIQKSLERLSDLFAKIQKALGEYLESQRQAFARFYFVGDEDLLEIIGNSKDVTNVQRHFPKMFAGIVSLISPDTVTIEAMTSRENEEVAFTNQVSISEDPIIYVWLSKIEFQMRNSLAHALDKTVAGITSGADIMIIANEAPA
jgi:dynein heavy chain 1